MVSSSMMFSMGSKKKNWSTIPLKLCWLLEYFQRWLIYTSPVEDQDHSEDYSLLESIVKHLCHQMTFCTPLPWCQFCLSYKVLEDRYQVLLWFKRSDWGISFSKEKHEHVGASAQPKLLEFNVKTRASHAVANAQLWAVGCLIVDKKSELNIALSIVNTYSEFQVNIFSNNRDIYKISQFLHNNDNDDTKAISIPWVLSRNSQAKNGN